MRTSHTILRERIEDGEDVGEELDLVIEITSRGCRASHWSPSESPEWCIEEATGEDGRAIDPGSIRLTEAEEEQIRIKVEDRVSDDEMPEELAQRSWEYAR